MQRQVHPLRAWRAGLMAGAAVLALAAPAFAQSAAEVATQSAATTSAAAAAAPAAEEGPGLQEVVVTAQKRTTNLQTTPIAISVLNSQQLEQRHVESLEDLMDGAIPSLRVAPFFARNSALTLGIRGVGVMSDANQPARDQAVGVYVDGVYLGRAQGLGAALYDLDHIEVLKGPQGTLFGRNTEGGAVSIVTKAPTGKFDMDATAGVSDYNGYEAHAHVDLPAFHDVAVKIDGLVTKRDGVVNNPNSSGQPDFNSFDRRGVSIEALWRPNREFSADYAFDDSYNATTPYYIQLLSKGLLPLAPLQHIQPDRAETANFGVPLQPSVGETSGHRLNLDWKFAPGFELKSISSYRELTQTQFDNGEENLSVYAPNAAFSRYSLANVWQNQYSEELQMIGSLPHLELVAGALYYHEFVHDNAQTPNSLQFNANGTGYTTLSLDLNTYPYDRASHVTTESYGVYGQGVWTPPVLNGIAHLTLGGRFTHDSKDGDLDVVNGAIPSYVNTAGQTITGIIPLNKSWDRFDPLVNLAVDVTHDISVYGKWSTGYKAGGANSRSLTFRPFDPETVSMFEVGTKTEFWDHRARLNLAAYTGDLKDVQIDFNVTVLNNNRGTLETTNAATGRTSGFEADFSVQPMTGLTLSASYAYTKVTLSQAFNPFTNAMAVVYPLYTPPNAASLAVDYERPMFGVVGRMHFDGNYSDGQYTASTDPTHSNRSFIVNGRLSLTDIRLKGGEELQLALWSRNLLDEAYLFVKNYNAALGAYGIYNEPRTFGVEARVKY